MPKIPLPQRNADGSYTTSPGRHRRSTPTAPTAKPEACLSMHPKASRPHRSTFSPMRRGPGDWFGVVYGHGRGGWNAGEAECERRPRSGVALCERDELSLARAGTHRSPGLRGRGERAPISCWPFALAQEAIAWSSVARPLSRTPRRMPPRSLVLGPKSRTHSFQDLPRLGVLDSGLATAGPRQWPPCASAEGSTDIGHARAST